MIDVGNWMCMEVDHYMQGFCAEPTESGSIVGIEIADPPNDFIITIRVGLGNQPSDYRKARLSMCLPQRITTTSIEQSTSEE